MGTLYFCAQYALVVAVLLSSTIGFFHQSTFELRTVLLKLGQTFSYSHLRKKNQNIIENLPH